MLKRWAIVLWIVVPAISIVLSVVLVKQRGQELESAARNTKEQNAAQYELYLLGKARAAELRILSHASEIESAFYGATGHNLTTPWTLSRVNEDARVLHHLYAREVNRQGFGAEERHCPDLPPALPTHRYRTAASSLRPIVCSTACPVCRIVWDRTRDGLPQLEFMVPSRAP